MKHFVLIALVGATMLDLAWLAKGSQLLDNIYLVTGPPFEAALASSTDGQSCSIPWFVALALGSYSRKHCFITGARLKMKEATTCIKHTTDKIKWAMHFAALLEHGVAELPLLRCGVGHSVVEAL